jgi:hypothetical protein
MGNADKLLAKTSERSLKLWLLSVFLLSLVKTALLNSAPWYHHRVCCLVLIYQLSKELKQKRAPDH